MPAHSHLPAEPADRADPARAVDAVLLDVGGVLLLPPPELVAPPLRAAGADPDPRALARAHYRAIAEVDRAGDFGGSFYRRAYAAACGVAEADLTAADAGIRDCLAGMDWSYPVPGVTAALARLAARVRLGVVSNASGSVERILREAAICQVGPGRGTEVGVVLDSALVGVEKPDPRIFRLALDALGVAAERTLFVGDTARIDIDGALGAGLRAAHLDPFGDCPDPPGSHSHVATLEEVLLLV